MKYFTISELEHSDIAERLLIDNSIPDHLLQNAECLIDFLSDLRDAWGSAIIVNSGYRCDYLNNKVGGSNTSAHRYALAADIIPSNGNMKKFQQFIKEWIKDKDFDQLILEKPINGIASWIHVGLRQPNTDAYRKQIFTIL